MHRQHIETPFVLTALLACNLSLPLAAQVERRPNEPTAPPQSLETHPAFDPGLLANIGRPIDRVHLDLAENGDLWARGSRWKMRFDARGATYHSAFGYDRPAAEFMFSPASITLAGRPLAFEAPRAVHGLQDRVELERGSFVEAYELTLDAVEQLFVFQHLPRRGELVVRIPLPQVTSANSDAQGLLLRSALGEVRYSHAVAIDARGQRSPAPTTFEEGAIVVRVPAAFVAGAQLPLVIDPYITHTWLDLSAKDCRDPDVVYDSFHDRWMVAFGELFAAGDNDVRVQAIDPNGFVTHDGYIDFSSEHWNKPRIAYLRVDSRSMVVGEVGAVGARIVRGRAVNPLGANLEFGPKLTLSGTQSGEKLAPTIGGDPYPSQPSYFCVAFQRENLQVLPEFEIQYVFVNSASQLSLGPVVVPPAGSLRDTQPSLSRSNGTHRWTLAFQRADPTTFGDIYACYIDANGVLTPPFGISAFNLARDSAPSASSPLLQTSRSAIAFQRRSGVVGQSDIVVALIQDGAVLHTANLSVLEGSGTQGLDQVEPSIDSDGRHFLVAYAEAFASNAAFYSTRVTELFLYGNQFGASQPHQEALAYGTLQRVPRVAASRKLVDGPNDFTIAFHLGVSATDYDVAASRFGSTQGGSWNAYCFGDGSGAVCPCGNSGAPGHGCGNSNFGAGAYLERSAGSFSTLHDTAVLHAGNLPTNTPCLLFQGTTQLTGAVFGEGLRCAGGFVVRMGVQSANANDVSFPAPGDPALSVRGAVPLEGASRTYQIWYRDSSPFCGTSNYNFTNGVHVLWAH